jgi:hypothetical protein
MNLSKNFTLEEMLESETARKLGITEQWTPPQDVILNLFNLCKFLLQPLRDALGSIRINSGWRCLRLNLAIGGVPSSWHLTGRAVDCEFDGVGGNQMIIEVVKELYLPFDQMIDEQHLGWIHLSYSVTGNRRQMLRMVDGKYEIMI